MSDFARTLSAVPRIPIIKAPTPVHEARFRGHRFMIKREDMTDETIYGGNKVRNLEFILADVLRRGHAAVATPIPVGSNFSAAFTGHALNLGIEPILCQVHLASHPQITDHQEFCESLGARLHTRSGLLKFPRQAIDLARAKLRQGAAIVAPGGSSALGALGHLKAFLEVAESVRRGEIRCPDIIMVGAGTGGTTAGLIAGITLTGLPIKVLAVRCAEPIICNRRRILALANKTLAFLGSNQKVNRDCLSIAECPTSLGYGSPLPDFDLLFKDFYVENKIELDRTYTSKVIKTLDAVCGGNHGQSHRILYWHTFSPLASRELGRVAFTA